MGQRSKIKRCHTEKIQTARICTPTFRIGETLCNFCQRDSSTIHIIMHAIRRNGKRRNIHVFFQHFRQRRKIRSVHKRNRRTCQRNEFRFQRSGGILNIPNKFLIVSHDGIDFVQARDINQTVLVVPANLIMRIISGITAGRIVHHRHAAQLIQGRTDTGHIRSINWYNTIRLSHRQQSHPHPFCTTRDSVSFSSRKASIISSASFRIPSNPYRPPPCTIFTK